MRPSKANHCTMLFQQNPFPSHASSQTEFCPMVIVWALNYHRHLKTKQKHNNLNRNRVLIMHLYIEYALLEFKESYSCHPTKSMNQNIVPWPFNIVAQSVHSNWDTGTWHRLIDVYNQTINFFLLQITLYILWQISILKNIPIHNFTHCNLFKSRLSATQQL